MSGGADGKREAGKKDPHQEYRSGHKSKSRSGALWGVLWALGIAGLVLIDQWTKWLAVGHLKGSADISLFPGVLELSYLENRGMAFGMLQGQRILFIVLCVAFFAALVWLFVRIPKTRYFLPLIATGAVLAAGALGNLIDRAAQGYVVDFIYISLIRFPVFNVADIYVVCGGILLVILALFRYRDEDFDFIFPGKRR